MKLIRALIIVSMLVFGIHARATAQGGCTSGGTACAPEIDPSLSGSEAVVFGVIVLLIRGRRSKR